MNKFAKFVILDSRQGQRHDVAQHVVAINLSHVVSVKPINIATADGMVRGHWVRLTNGKKYKATEIPQEILDVVKNSDENLIDDDDEDFGQANYLPN